MSCLERQQGNRATKQTPSYGVSIAVAKISGFKNPGFKRYLSYNKKHRAVDQDHALSAVGARASSVVPKSCVGLRRAVRGLLRNQHQTQPGFATGHISSYIGAGAHPTGSFLTSHPSLKNGKKSLPGSAVSHARGRACQKAVCFGSVRRTVRKKRKKMMEIAPSPPLPMVCGTKCLGPVALPPWHGGAGISQGV